MTQYPNRTNRPLWQQYVVMMAVAAAIAVVTGVVLMFRSAEEIDQQPIAQAEPHPTRASTAPEGDVSAATDDQEPPRSPPSVHAEAPPKIGPFESLESQNGPSPTEQDSPTSTAQTKQPPADPHPSAVDRPPIDDTITATANSTSTENSAEPSQKKSAEPQTAAAPEQPTQTPSKSSAVSESENTWLKLNDHGEPCEVTLANGTVLKLDTYGDEYEGYDYRPPMTLYDPKLHKLIDFKHVHGHGNGIVYLQFDSKSNRMYWAFFVPPHQVGRIVRADLNGRGITDLVTDLENIFGFTIDPQRKRMYWAERKSNVDSVKRANLDGSQIEDIVPGAQGTGMAVEPESGDVFYWTEESSNKYSINRIKADGSGEKQIISDLYVARHARQLLVEPSSRKLYWKESGGSIRRANYDGSDAEFVVDLAGHGNFALDMGDKKVYWSGISELCRANLDGSQAEVLVVTPPEHENPEHREMGQVAFEPEHRSVYVSWHYFEGWTAIGALSRMEVPALPKPVRKPPPPWIECISPAKQAADGEVIIKGKNLKDATKVALFDDGNGHEVAVSFDVHSDSELSFTMPELSEGCAHAAVIVLSPGGVTVTLPITTSLARPNIWVPLPGSFDINTDLVAGKYANIWYVQGQRKRMFNVNSQETKTINGGGIKSLIYAEDGSRISTKERGNNILFLKNGAITGMSRWRTVIYHEPFARIGNNFLRSAEETETTLVPVPAIRPSFLPELLEYEQPQ